jgi:thiol-disulfide isomerase/thioredoxin
MKGSYFPAILALAAIAAPQTGPAKPVVASAAGIVIREGKRVPGAEVLIIEQDAGGKRCITDKFGRYSIPGPLLAGYYLVAQKGRWVSIPQKIGNTSKVVLDRPVASVSGTVRRDDGTPAVGAEVIIAAEYRGTICTSEKTRTDRNGRYRFSNQNGELDRFSVSVLPDRSGYQEGASFYLEPGEKKRLAPITVRRRDGEVEGTVLDSHGRPAPDVTVTPDIGYVQAKSDKTGRFRLTGIARGEVNLNALGPDGAQGEVFTKTGQKGAEIKLSSTGSRTEEVSESTPAPPAAPPLEVGRKAPELKVSRWVTGVPISIAHCKGRVVLLDFWSVTCGPCIRAFPEIEDLYRRYRSKGLVVTGICFPEAPAKVLRLVQNGKLTYPNAIDAASGSDIPVTASRFPFQGTPTLVVLDRQGRLAWSGSDVDGANHWVRRELGLFR